MNSFVYVWAAAKTTISQHTTTTTGSLSGVIVDGVATYRGVPYARPPLGDLRWRPPVPVTPWSGVRAADKDGPGCPQECLLPALTCPPVTSEDCLYLNVFAPANATVTSSGSAAVLLFIHGGNFIQGYGGGPLYDGSMLVQSHGVVVVSINYRLGALGWLFTGAPPSEEPTDDLVGNYGLLDQQLAMRWVQANAAAFGGDPSRITLFGQSAGAQSISCHLTMPSSKGLFAGAILESAPLGLTWRTAEQSPKFTGLVAKLGGCIGTTPGEYVPCLRAMPVETLLVWGDADALVGRPVIDQLLVHRPDWVDAVMPGVGHVPMMEEPERYVAVVRAWLEGRPVTEVDGVVRYEAPAAD